MTTHEKLRDEGNSMMFSYIKSRRSSGIEYPDLLQMLLDVRYEDTGEGMTDVQLIDECNILFIAGHETSANALSWAFFLLGQHPAEKKFGTKFDKKYLIKRLALKVFWL